MNRSNKHAQIYALHYINIEDADIDNYPGRDQISITGCWIELKVNSVILSEEQKNVGDFYNVELKATITDTTSSVDKAINRAVILKIDYTNNVSKVLGTEHTPIFLSQKIDGNPSVITLSYKGLLPECAKILKSF